MADWLGYFEEDFPQTHLTHLNCKIWPPELLLTLDEDLKNWTMQGFQRNKEPELSVGFFQGKNGPCGLLASIQAELLVDLIYGQPGWKNVKDVLSENDLNASLARALSKILIRSQKAEKNVKLVVKKYEEKPISLQSTENLKILITDNDSITNVILKNIRQFLEPGGLVLILYSLVLTRGIDQISLDMLSSPDASIEKNSLIVGNWALCSQALVCLCMFGVALPCVDDESMSRYDGEVDIGFLTFEELENQTFGSGYSVLSDRLKHPKYPIWIIHGGDHYTTLFGFDKDLLKNGVQKKNLGIGDDSGLCANGCGFYGNPATFGFCSSCYKKLNAQQPTGEREKCKGKDCEFYGSQDFFGYCSYCYKNLPEEEKTKLKQEKEKPVIDKPVIGEPYNFQIFLYNGLPPSGPVLSEMVVSKDNKEEVKDDNNTMQDISMVIQRKWIEEGPSNNGAWLYEVALRKKENKEPNQEQKIEQAPETEWRCSYCVQNQIFTYNPPKTETCQQCGQHIADCGQTIWVPYERMPYLLKREADSRYLPKIQSLLMLRWPNAQVDYCGKKPPTI